MDNGNGTHSQKCDVCGEMFATGDHVYTEGKAHDNGDGTHSKVCDACGAVSTEKISHDYKTTYIQGEKHTKKCTDCDNTVTEECHYVYEAISGQQHHQVCESCKHEKRNSTENCVEDPTNITYDENKHYYTCRLCKKQYKSFKHSFSDKWEITPYVSSDTDMGTHYKVCKVCGYKANEETHKFETTQGYINHTQTEKGGVGVMMTCSECGYTYKTIVREDDDFNHIWEYNTENDDEDTYTKTCRICGATQTESKEQYNEYQEQLRQAKEKAYSDIQNYYVDKLNNEKEYHIDELLKIVDKIWDDSKEEIDSAKTIEDVNSIFEKYKALIEEYKIGGLIDVKKQCIEEMENAINDYFPPIIGDHSIGFESDLEVLDKQEEYEDKINEAKTIEEAERLKKEFLDWLAKFMKENYNR